MRVLSFNGPAAAAIQARKGGRVRLDVEDGTLFMRPTDRKAGPHVLTELEGKGEGIEVQVSDKQLEKLGASGILTADTTLGLVADKYGWFSLVASDREGAIEGAEIAIEDRAEA